MMAGKIDPMLFQSTPPARGATRAGSLQGASAFRFQSTPPARGATAAVDVCLDDRVISIHAPREGGDPPRRYSWGHNSKYFNPRPPRGGRRLADTRDKTAAEFQSTPPARGATLVVFF